MSSSQLRAVRPPGDDAVRLDDLVELHLEDLATRSRPASVERASGILARLVEALGNPIPTDLSAPDLLRHRAARLRAGAAKATVNREIGCLQTLLRWAKGLGLIERNPISGLRRLAVREEDRRMARRALEPLEVRAFLLAAMRRDREVSWDSKRCGWKRLPQAVLWLAFLDTGARRGELLALRWFHVSLERAEIRFDAASTKTGRTRVVPIPEPLVRRLRKLRPLQARFLGVEPDELEAAFVFLSPEGAPWAANPDNLSRTFRSILKRAGLRRRDERGRWLTVHALRHTVGTNLARAGVHPTIAKALLGHSDVRITLEYYTHAEAPDLRGGVEALRKHRMDQKGTQDPSDETRKGPGGEWSGREDLNLRPLRPEGGPSPEQYDHGGPKAHRSAPGDPPEGRDSKGSGACLRPGGHVESESADDDYHTAEDCSHRGAGSIASRRAPSPLPPEPAP